jgi:predicted DNA-binding WGR domain protein
MKTDQIILNWRNVDSATNKRRWYHLHTSHDLWGRPIVICRWGRIDGQQNEQIYWYKNKDGLRQIVHKKINARNKHDYIVLR